jgi:hypothetical protein
VTLDTRESAVASQAVDFGCTLASGLRHLCGRLGTEGASQSRARGSSSFQRAHSEVMYLYVTPYPITDRPCRPAEGTRYRHQSLLLGHRTRLSSAQVTQPRRC